MAVGVLLSMLAGCMIEKTISPELATHEVQTVSKGGKCGKGDAVTVTMKNGKQHHFEACEVTDTYIASCKIQKWLFAKEVPPIHYMLADAESIRLRRNTEPCWTRSIGGVGFGAGAIR